ncbi:hypothetical protein Acr_00g0060210 [Actinidia rufa]|uniref:Uncharacterized protein n=1 Tax=Actinidia rufa TaxID=165716 RepID=A0A7J0DNB4_9ERIC|nr:hypothetical protein Acr_00g0060210 [Actinidia rufa]
MLGHSTVQIQGAVVTISLADRVAMVDKEVSELKSLIGATAAVGLAVYPGPYYSKPAILKGFPSDQEICRFVAVTIDIKLWELNSEYRDYGIECKNGIEVSELAARRFFKKLSICGRSFAELAAEVVVAVSQK